MGKATGVRQGRVTKKKGRNRRKRDPFGTRAKRFFVRALWVTVIAAALPVSSYGAWRLYGVITTTEYLAVERVTVDGAFRTGTDSVIELSGIESGENIFSFKLASVEQSIRENPWIESAKVSRSIPSTVRIEVAERVPKAIVSAEGLFVMDSGGLLFKRYSVVDGLDLPVVTGLDADEIDSGVFVDDSVLMGLLNRLDGRNGFNTEDVSEIHVDTEYGYTLYTVDEGVMLELGTEDFESKLGRFERIVRARGGTLTGVAAIDLTRESDVVIKYIGNVVKEGGAT